MAPFASRIANASRQEGWLAGSQDLGSHAVTAIAGDPQRNLGFYTSVLGLRLVKLTVSFNDPGTCHFYFGNESRDTRIDPDVLSMAARAARQSRDGSGDRDNVRDSNWISAVQMGGVPCLRGLRIPVATVVALVADGQTTEGILALYPDLEADDVREALLFAAEAVRERALALAAGE